MDMLPPFFAPVRIDGASSRGFYFPVPWRRSNFFILLFLRVLGRIPVIHQILPSLEIGIPDKFVFVEGSFFQSFLGFEQSGANVCILGGPLYRAYKGCHEKAAHKNGVGHGVDDARACITR